MDSASWTHSGRILLNASRVYYLPDEPSLPPLRWLAEKQTFAYLSSANNEDLELRASITELAQACSQLYHLPSVQQQSFAASLSCYLPCEALYGVLPLGSVNSALLYVTAKEYVCSLSVGGARHDVYAVRGLQWLSLPCVTSAATAQQQRRRQQRQRRRRGRDSQARSRRTSRAGPRGVDDDEELAGDEVGGKSPKAAQHRSGAEDGDGTDGSDTEVDDDADSTDADGEEDDDDDDDDDGDASEVVGRLPGKTVNDYLAVLHRFCEAINTQDGNSGGEDGAKGTTTPHDLPGIAGPAGSFSYLYYSPTLDLSADPVHLLGLISNTAHPSLAVRPAAAAGAEDTADSSLASTATTTGLERNPSDTLPELGAACRPSRHSSALPPGHAAWEDRRAAATTRHLYQWNGPLLVDGFALPTMPQLRAELMYAGNGESAPPLPWRGVCAEEVQRDGRALSHASPRLHHGSLTATYTSSSSAAAATADASSAPLYVPSFIRGLVAQSPASPRVDMTLLTRTCCRWAGTRYNRRGLEPGHGGVVANMSLTSLWVTPSVQTATAASHDAAAVGRSEDGEAWPFAVYTVMRGSVPRRWEQPANLSLKPAIKISPLSSAADEMGRHVRMLKQCLPELQALICLDTMSQSKLEEPLSEAFAAAVRRFSEGTPKGNTPSTSALAEDKSGGGGAQALADGGSGGAGQTDGAAGAAAAVVVAAPNPKVALVKFNVKKELKRHPYETMMRRCLAEVDSAVAAEASESGSFLDFTRGSVRCMRDDEAARVGSDDRDGSSLSNSLTPSLTTGNNGAERQGSGDHQTAESSRHPRLCFESLQSRLVRVNCLDCLDRTNLVQSILLCAVLPRMMAYVDRDPAHQAAQAAAAAVTTAPSRMTMDTLVTTSLHDPAFAAASHQLRVLMAAQGTALSQLYAGTEPHFLPYMLSGRHHWSHKAMEAVLAQRRWYQQNFHDGVKQDGISLVTRQHNPQVFNADIESPFSRDLSGMNRQVMYGLLLGVFPLLYCVMVCLAEHRFGSAVFQLHFGICLCWVVYLSVLYNKLMRYRVTYTNRPLLLYTRQAEWF